MVKDTFQLILHRFSKNANLTEAAFFFNTRLSLTDKKIKSLLTDLPRIIYEVSTQNEGAMIQAGLDELGCITTIESVTYDVNGDYSIFKKHLLLLKRELSKSLRARICLAFFWIKVEPDDENIILPSMMGGFQEQLSAHFRDSDTIIGINEEQVLLLGFATDRKGGQLVQNKLKRVIHELIPMPLKVKIGCSIFPNEARSLSSLFRQAKPGEEIDSSYNQLEVRTVLPKHNVSVSSTARDRQRTGTIQLYFTRARGQMFQQLLTLDAKTLWHGVSKLVKKDQYDFLNRLPFDYKLAPALEKIINSNPAPVADKRLEKQLEDIILPMALEENLKNRKRNAVLITDRLENFQALPVLPGVALKLFKILSDPDSTMNTLAGVIETDLSLTLKLLKIVNSAFYGFFRKIDTVKEAVLVLGTDEIKNLAFGLSAAKTLQNIDFKGMADPNNLWYHSIGTALIAEHICRKAPEFTKTGAFTAGLIHDTGKIFLIEHFSALYNDVYTMAAKFKVPIFEIEEEKFELNHAVIGKLVATSWNLPKNLSQAIAGHHQPQGSLNNSSLAAVIGLSDHLCHSTAVPFSPSKETAFPPPYLTFGQFCVLKRLFKGFSKASIKAMAEETTALLAENQELFALT